MSDTITNVHPGDVLEFKIQANIYPESELEKSEKSVKTSMSIETERETYQVELLIKFSSGSLDFFPKVINQNVLFPFASEMVSVTALSSYQDSISLSIPHKSGQGSALLDLITFNRVLNRGIKENFIQFKLDPSHSGFPKEHMFTQKNHTDTEICLMDLD